MAKKTEATGMASQVEQIQSAAATDNPKARPLTGVEVAEILAAEQPEPFKPGQRFRLKDRVKPETAAVIVESPDGTIEDAVRAYNQGRTDIRTAKQLTIEPLAS